MVSDWIPQQTKANMEDLMFYVNIACFLPRRCFLPFFCRGIPSGGNKYWKGLHDWLIGRGFLSLTRAQLSSVSLISNMAVSPESMEMQSKLSYTVLVESLCYMLSILDMFFGETDRNIILQQPDWKALIQLCLQKSAALGNRFEASNVNTFATVYLELGSLFFHNQRFLTRQMSNETNEWEPDVMLAAWPLYLGCITSTAYHCNIQRDFDAKTQMNILRRVSHPLRILDGKEAAIRQKYVVRHISAVLDIAAFAINDGPLAFKRSNDSEGFNRSEIIQAMLDMSAGCLHEYGTLLA